MKTHSIRLTEKNLGFIIDDEIAFCQNFDEFIIHLNKGPKKQEDYKNYWITDKNDICTKCTDSKNIICNERLYIDIVCKDNVLYMRGFIANLLETDLNCTTLTAGNNLYIVQKGEYNELNEYLKSVFGERFYKKFNCGKKINGIRVFENRIYINVVNRTFSIDLNYIPLKDEFKKLIKANVDKIKQFLFPLIPYSESRMCSTY